MATMRRSMTAAAVAWVWVAAAIHAQVTSPPAAAPVEIVPASSDEAAVSFRITDLDALTARDITLGALTSTANPNHHIVPVLRKADVAGAAKDWTVSLVVGNLIPFGESTVPVLIRGEAKRTLRFQKPGLIARAPAGTTFDVKEGQPLFVVLENPTAFAYANVRARWRFHHTEVCSATVDAPAASATPQAAARCEDPATWIAFRVDQHAPVTLRVTPAAEWFRDDQTGFPRAAKRSGMLTLRYTGEGPSPRVYEQSLPLEVQFNPGDASAFRNLLRIAWWLLTGALLALGLRVAVPNYRRKESLKDQLRDAEEAIRDILVETALQVLLKVETFTLDTLRRRSWILGPSFQDLAQRTEQALGVLRRKIEFSRRLDTARSRRLTLINHDVPPTRLDVIDRQLDAACDVLLREQLTEQDWVFAQQRLEAADKLLAEPSTEEKDAFHAFLVQRWKSVKGFFGVDGRALKIPDALKGLEAAFPPETALPEIGADGSDWIQAIGPMRADLQLTALEILRDFLFLAASVPPEARERLTHMLTTPSLTELHAARLLIREISEGVDVTQVLTSLRACEAVIEITPESVRPNEKANLALGFRNPKLDVAAARLAVRCEWVITPAAAPVPGVRRFRIPRWRRRRDPAEPQIHRAYGWEIHHCFPESATAWEVRARFYCDGEAVLTTPDAAKTDVLEYKQAIRLQARRQDWGNRVERIFPEAIQLVAALLVPLATLAVTQSTEGTSGRWWELVGVGFGSEMIRSILTGKSEQSP